MSIWAAAIPAAITAISSLLGNKFSQDASIKEAEKERQIQQQQFLQQLELEKLRIAKSGGGGGRSRDLDLLEMALGIYGDQGALMSNTLNKAADRYAGIYGSTMGK